MKNDVCENNGRYTEIDIAKGIGILLVVIGHAVPDANTGIMNDFWGGAIQLDIFFSHGFVHGYGWGVVL